MGIKSYWIMNKKNWKIIFLLLFAFSPIFIRVILMYYSTSIGIHEENYNSISSAMREELIVSSSNVDFVKIRSEPIPWENMTSIPASFYSLSTLMMEDFQRKIDSERSFQYDYPNTNCLTLTWQYTMYQNVSVGLNTPDFVYVGYFNTTEWRSYSFYQGSKLFFVYCNPEYFPNNSPLTDYYHETPIFQELHSYHIGIQYDFILNSTFWTKTIQTLSFSESIIVDENGTLIVISIGSLSIKNQEEYKYAYLFDIFIEFKVIDNIWSNKKKKTIL